MNAKRSKSEAHRSGASTDLGEREHAAKHPHGQHIRDELGERLGENAVRQMTSDDNEDFEGSDENLESDVGGPFVTSDGSTEYSDDDAAMPEDAEIAAAPRLRAEGPESPEETLVSRDDEEEEED